LLASIVAGSGYFNVTSVEAGQGFPGGSDNPAAFAGLKSFVMNAVVTSMNDVVNYQATILTQVSSALAPETFYWNEFGVFANDGSGAPVMVAYGTTGSAEGGDQVTVGGPSPVVRKIGIILPFTPNLSVSTSLSLTNVVEAHAGTHEGTGASAAGSDPIPNSTNANSGLLAAVPMTPNYSPVSVGDGTHAWQPIIPVIIANTILYVSTTGNDSTAQFNNSSLPWLTLQGAITSLEKYFIVAGVSVNIINGPGIFSISSTININHPQGSQISITGATAAQVSATGVGAVGGSTGAYTVPITGVSSTAGMSVNGWVIVNSISGSTANMETLLRGIFQISAISGSTVTIKVPYSQSSFPSVAGITSLTLAPINTIISVANNITGINIGGGGLSQLNWMAFIAQSTPTVSCQGVNCIAPANLSWVGVYGYNNSTSGYNAYGFYIFGGTTVLTNCAATKNQNGMAFSAVASSTLIFCAGTHCGNFGLWAEASNIGIINGFSHFGASGSYGVLVDSTSNLTVYANPAGGLTIQHSLSYGLSIQNRSSASFQNTNVSIENNGPYDVYLSILSTCSGTANIGGTRDFNFTSGVLTAQGCYPS